jgi:DNA-binding NtrC family response regulator
MAKILLVSGDDAVWTAFNTAVSPDSHETYAGDSVTDALHSEVAECFDIVVLDIVTPDNGILRAIIELQHARSSVRWVLLIKGLADLSSVDFLQSASAIPGVEVTTRRGMVGALERATRPRNHLMAAA